MKNIGFYYTGYACPKNARITAHDIPKEASQGTRVNLPDKEAMDLLTYEENWREKVRSILYDFE